MKDKNGLFKYIVGGTILLAFLIIVYALAFKSIAESNKDIFIHTIGIVEGAVITMVGYYFGTSSGSKEKSEVIAEALKTEQTKP
jgi:hypothetical protein